MLSVKPSPDQARTARGEATMLALLDAAVDCLVELGFPNTTTAEISRRAGVSPGLFVRYWPTKAALLAAAAAHAHRRTMARFEARFGVILRGTDPHTDDTVRLALRRSIAAVVELHSEPDMRCLAELAHAARTDPDLATEVARATLPVEEFVLRSARRLAPPDSLGPHFDANVRLLHDCARGVAQRAALLPPDQAAAARAEVAASMARLVGLDDG